MPTLFDPLRTGDLLLPNRILMAPLTRRRAGGARVPNALMARYYEQRASAGLILSEATSVTPVGVGYADTPGIWSRQQVESWRLVTQAVHRAGGRIFLQLWHVGRVSHPMFLGGASPVAEGFTRETAEQAIAANDADAVAFGKLFIANPDLPLRFARKTPLNQWNADTFYSGGQQGYVDYPQLEASRQAVANG